MGKKMCVADNSCAPLHCARSPTWNSNLCYSEVTVSTQPSIGCGRCNPTVPFLGSRNYQLLPRDFSDTLMWDILGILQSIQKCWALNIWGVSLSIQGWELTDKCFCLSSPKQTALTHFIRLLRMCHRLEQQSPVCWSSWYTPWNQLLHLSSFTCPVLCSCSLGSNAPYNYWQSSLCVRLFQKDWNENSGDIGEERRERSRRSKPCIVSKE